VTDNASSTPGTQDEQLRAVYTALNEDERIQLAAPAAAVVGRVTLREARALRPSSRTAKEHP
jgi:hypothetical protein